MQTLLPWTNLGAITIAKTKRILTGNGLPTDNKTICQLFAEVGKPIFRETPEKPEHLSLNGD